MALTKCKECNHEISDQAQSCPNCGAPQKPKSKGMGLGKWILILLVAWIDLPPLNSAIGKLVKSALGRRSGREEEVY